MTLEPCSTHGRTPPCTSAIVAAGINRVAVGATDPNPDHRGRAFRILKRAGIRIESGLLADECTALNEAFNHWIVNRTPLVTVKAAMTLDGRIATTTGESKWITGKSAREWGMHLRLGSDAILVGIQTLLADDPRLNFRTQKSKVGLNRKRLKRIVLDAMARTPLTATVACDESAADTMIVVSRFAPAKRVAMLAKRVEVIVAPARKDQGNPRINLGWLLKRLGEQGITHLFVEGGGEVNASFLLGGFADRVAFFYAPKILGGRDAPRAVAGLGVPRVSDGLKLTSLEGNRFGEDFFLGARVLKR